MRVDLDLAAVSLEAPGDDLIDLDEALDELARGPALHRLVTLRFFSGLSQGEAARILGLPRRTADRHWAYAKAWLFERLRGRDDPDDGAG